MGHGHIPVMSDHGISTSTDVFKLSVAWLIRKILMENVEKITIFLSLLPLFGGKLFGLDICCTPFL